MARRSQHAIAAGAANLHGYEPTYEKLNEGGTTYTAELLRIFNWYSAEKTRADSYKYHVEFCKKFRSKDDLKTFQTISEKDIHTTYGWVARILTKGGILTLDQRERFESYLDGLIRVARKEAEAAVEEDTPVVVETKKVVNIQDAIKAKAMEYIGELEGSFDDFCVFDTEFSLYNDMKGNQLPGQYAQYVKEWAEAKLAHFTEVSSSKDSQIVEGYSNFNKRKMKAILKYFETVIEDCDKYGQFKKANRKPRAVRKKSPADQIKNLKYKLKDDELNITSAKAIDIPGSEQVWLFNTKTRKLSVYTSDSSQGLQVKGTTLQNWLPEKSKQKTLRKPADQIKDLMGSGKVKLRNFMDGIKSKEQAVNGRINIDTIILRIMR